MSAVTSGFPDNGHSPKAASIFLAAYKDALTVLGEAVESAVLYDNAARVYRLD
ncbi:MAG: hypothetical protein P4L80_11150 [Xanthobacteraceae bacterium]|nr:hypothetical protein [Xanthobacteraceae bacterium]